MVYGVLQALFVGRAGGCRGTPLFFFTFRWLGAVKETKALRSAGVSQQAGHSYQLELFCRPFFSVIVIRFIYSPAQAGRVFLP